MVIRRSLFTLAAVTAALAATGCGDAPATKAGGSIEPITLDARSYTQTGRTASDQLAHFARRVSALSGGAVKIRRGPEPNNSLPDTSTDAIARVRAGDAAIAIVSSRSFDLLGVTSVQALQAPFLIDSQALGDRVLADPIADEMLGGFSEIGLTGLALTYDSLTVPIGFGRPLVSPGDFAGAVIASRPSRTGDAVLRALGAKPSPKNGDDVVEGARTGTIQGGVDGLEQPTSPVGGPATANLPLYLKTNALIISEKVFDGLSDRQQGVLRQAARETRTWSRSHRPSATAAVSAYCKSGRGDVVLATPAQRAGLRTLARPLIAKLEKDAFTRRAIARIRTLGKAVRPPDLAACRARDPNTAPSAEPTVTATGDQTILDGKWRLEVDPDALMTHGVSGPDVGNNSGIWNLTFSNGRITGFEPHGVSCVATYVIDGDRFAWSGEPNSACGGHFVVQFRRTGDRTQFTPIWSDAETGGVTLLEGFFANPLRRIGGAE